MLRALGLGVLCVLAAIPLALLVHRVALTYEGQPEKSVMMIGVVLGLIWLIPAGVYIGIQRWAIDPGRLGLILVATTCVLLAAIYFYTVGFLVFYPADILRWSESDFVNDIIKLRTGYPIFSDQRNNESFIYPPGSQLLTYGIAWLMGQPTSLAAYRIIQLFYTLLTAIVAACCVHRIVKIAWPSLLARDQAWWMVIWVPMLFLIATNSLTNPFVHNMHNDAMSQLIAVVGFWLLLLYVDRRDWKILVLMAILPSVGFMVKQSQIIWAGLYCLHLAVFDRPRSIKRLMGFASGAFGGIGVTVGVCYLIWGDPFIYWIFTVLSKHGTSPLRSFQHGMDVWVYLAIGLVSGMVLLRGRTADKLLGPWVVWLCFISAFIYTSGIAWMLNHIGPGSLLAGIWFLAGLFKLWPRRRTDEQGTMQMLAWIRAGTMVAIVCLLLSGFGVIRIPLKPLSDDAYRYKEEVEKEFATGSTKRILIDAGSWVYLKEGVVMKDRVPSIGDRGFGESGDFSGILGRLEDQFYEKIMVHNLHADNFWYDHSSWRKSSGIKQTLLEHYQEVRQIKAIEGNTPFFGTQISVLVPKGK